MHCCIYNVCVHVIGKRRQPHILSQQGKNIVCTCTCVLSGPAKISHTSTTTLIWYAHSGRCRGSSGAFWFPLFDEIHYFVPYNKLGRSPKVRIHVHVSNWYNTCMCLYMHMYMYVCCPTCDFSPLIGWFCWIDM